MRLISKTAVLDKGHVGLFSYSIGQSDLNDIQSEYFRGIINYKMLELPEVVLDIRCPLFFQLFLSEFQLTITSSKVQEKPEAFVPTVADISTPDLSVSEEIQKDIDHTTAALLINPKAYQLDKCDTFISQVISPISMYNQLMVSGRLSEWVKVVNKPGCPVVMQHYQTAIREVLKSEWKHLDEYIKKLSTTRQ